MQQRCHSLLLSDVNLHGGASTKSALIENVYIKVDSTMEKEVRKVLAVVLCFTPRETS
jgi:hypothetical protein